MNTSIALTQERLKELFHYDPDTGIFTWLVSRNSRIRIGDIAGSKRTVVTKKGNVVEGYTVTKSDGYVSISIDGVKYYAHRLAWLYMKGIWPEFEIDHKDTVCSNNRWENLRDKTHQINMQNRHKANRNNVSGFLGVTKVGKKFLAKIRCGKKVFIFGPYLTPEFAHEVYLNTKRELHPGCTI